jgi:hypothetical protein
MWRLLEKGEVTRHDDEYWSADRWHVWGSYHAGDTLVLDVPVRRWAGEKPTVEPVRVGDRVEVVSGTWAKSCGRIVSDSIEMALSGKCDVRLDNVFVGGKPLTIRVFPSEVSAQKCAPKASVQADHEWRLLEKSETALKGDQYYDSWERTWYDSESYRDPVLNGKQASGQYRRRVRIESPGWRYLDAGETVQAGDETSFGWEAVWKEVSRYHGTAVGKPVSDISTRFFRRKTTPFAG